MKTFSKQLAILVAVLCPWGWSGAAVLSARAAYLTIAHPQGADPDHPIDLVIGAVAALVATWALKQIGDAAANVHKAILRAEAADLLIATLLNTPGGES